MVWADEIGEALVTVGGSIDGGKRIIPVHRGKCELTDGGFNGHLRCKLSFRSGQGANRVSPEGCSYGHLRRKLLDCSDVTDEDGESAVEILRSQRKDKVTLHAFGKGPTSKLGNGVIVGHREGKGGLQFGTTPGKGSCCGEGGGSNSLSRPATYKEALLWRGKTTQPPSVKPPKKYPSYQRSKLLPCHPSARRCFRCLASDHLIADCRDPVRCRRCLRLGHRVHQCKAKRGLWANAEMFRLNQRQGRPGRVSATKVFVPYTEEYLRRQEMRRNAVLADVIQLANLGPDPVSTIKNAMVRRFGGYNDDFAVARHGEGFRHLSAGLGAC